MALEIVPEKDPTALHEGDEIAVGVLKNAALTPNFRSTQSRRVRRKAKPGRPIPRDG